MTPRGSLAIACGAFPISIALRLERDSYSFNVHLLIGGQVKGKEPGLYLVYPQGNPLAATEDSLYLQLGECKYGRPILDRGIQASTSLEVAAKYALLSMDATMRSNVTVGPPFDLLLYQTRQPRRRALPPRLRRRSRLEFNPHELGAIAAPRRRTTSRHRVRGPRWPHSAGRRMRATAPSYVTPRSVISRKTERNARCVGRQFSSARIASSCKI